MIETHTASLPRAIWPLTVLWGIIPRRVRQNILAGDLKWKGPLPGFVFILFFTNCANFILFLVTKSNGRLQKGLN